MNSRVFLLLFLVAVAAGLTVYLVVLPMLEFKEETPKIEAAKTIKVFSSAFENGSYIPEKYSLEGGDVSPPLSWSNIPEGTVCYVLIVVDPDAPGGLFTHWILYDIPVNVTSLPEDIPKTLEVEGIGVQGYNDYGRIGYGGPHPPKGSTHRYIFRVYALDKTLNLKPGARLKDVLEAMDAHILGYGELVGLFSR